MYSVKHVYFQMRWGIRRPIDSLDRLLEVCFTRMIDIHKLLGIPYLGLASAYAMLDDKKKNLFYLSELEKTGLFEMPCSLNSFPFDNLRNDPEFKAIVKRIEDQRTVQREKVREMELSGELHL